VNPEQAYSETNTKKILRIYKEWLQRSLPDDRFPNITFRESPKFADFDFYVYFDGELDHYIEVKERRNTINKYKSTKVPLRKHSTAEHFMNAYGIRTYFVCGFTDCVAVLNLWEEPDEDTTMVDRYDRGDDEDIYAMYRVTRFRKISVFTGY